MQPGDAVRYIYEHPGVAPQEISAHLEISGRTLRSYIHRANAMLDGIASIELSRGVGYTVTVLNERSFSAWLAMSDAASSSVPQTSRDRIAYLLNDLLSRSDWITLDELSERLFCSRSVLSNDLKSVERMLGIFDLTLRKRPHYGMRVEGDEFDRRLCLAATVMRRKQPPRAAGTGGTRALDDFLSDAAFGIAGDRDVLKTVARCVDIATESNGFHVNPVAYQNLLVHITIALARIKSGRYVPLEHTQLERIESVHEYKVAASISDAIAAELGISLPQEEVAYIAIHLAGKRIVDSPGDGDGNLVISDETWRVVEDMLEQVWMAFHIDFRSDLELRMNLARHVAPLMVRLRFRMDLSNPLLGEIKMRYPFAWSIAVEGCMVLAAWFGTVPSEDEIGYIALAFALALERRKSSPKKRSILVVCATGAGSARLLEYRCRKEFGEYVDKIVVSDVSGIGKVDLSQIDYVFTTVPLDRELPVPVREVTYFFDDAEAERMRQLLSRPASSGTLARAFDRTLFLVHRSCASKAEAIAELCARVKEAHPVDDRLEELVWAREEVAPTSFGNSVAMPHPLEPACDRTLIAVSLLDAPLAWDERGTTVRAIFLICYERAAGRSLDALFSALAELFMDERAIRELVREQSFECLERLAGAISLPARAAGEVPQADGDIMQEL